MPTHPTLPFYWRHALAFALWVFLAYGVWSLPKLLLTWQPSIVAVPVAVLWVSVAVFPVLTINRGSKLLPVVVAALGATTLRVLLGKFVSGHVASGDANIYLVLAENLRVGRGFTVFDPFMGVDTRALFPPLYPVALVCWDVVAGLSTTSLVVLGMIIDLLTAAAILALAKALGNSRAGIKAAWLYLIWPSTLLSAPLAQKEGLCSLLAVLLALQWVRYVSTNQPRLSGAAAIGFIGGMLALTQPGELPLVGLFGLVALATGVHRRHIISLAALPVAMAVTMLPWWVRNATVFGSFVPLTSAGGYGLWIGNNPHADGHWMPPPASLYGLPEIAFGRAAAKIAINWIISHPGDFIKVTFAKALRGWGVAEFGARRLVFLKPLVDSTICSSIFMTSQVLHFSLLAIAALKINFSRVSGFQKLLLLVLACVMQTLIFGVFFEFGERHREFATPFLLLLATWGTGEISRPVSQSFSAADSEVASRVVPHSG